MTYRWKKHVGPNGDFNLGYRTLDEAKPWMDNDQVAKVGALLGAEKRQRIESEVDTEIKATFAFTEGHSNGWIPQELPQLQQLKFKGSF